MIWTQIVVTVFDVAWLLAVLALLFLMWRNNVWRIARMEATLIEATLKSADAAKQAAQAAQDVASYLERRHAG